MAVGVVGIVAVQMRVHQALQVEILVLLHLVDGVVNQDHHHDAAQAGKCLDLPKIFKQY